MANLIAGSFSRNSSNENYHPGFQKFKEEEDTKSTDRKSTNTHTKLSNDTELTIEEFKTAIQVVKVADPKESHMRFSKT